MPTNDPPRQHMIRLLRDPLLPWLRAGATQLVLVYPPRHVPPGVQVVPQTAPLLRIPRQVRAHEVLGQWAKAGLVASRYPRLGVVLEGEADVNFGLTEKMAAALSPASVISRYTLQLPARSIMLIPPGVPTADGSRPHWERPHLEKSHSRILWITFINNGVALHGCTSQGAAHGFIRGCFVNETRLNPLIHLLLETAALPGPGAREIAASILLSLTLLLEEKCSRGPIATLPEDATAAAENVPPTGPVPRALSVRQACDYIQGHIAQHLTAETIANHIYVSVPHLNRLFRSELGASVFTYITAQRIELAKTLLQTTDFSIRDVSHSVGYVHPNYLSRVFVRATGKTPLQYRQQSRAQSSTAST